MNWLTIYDRTSGGPGLESGHVAKSIGIRATVCPEDEQFTFARKHNSIVGVAQATRRLGQRIEHRLQIERRAADNLQHVGGRGLLLQRLVRSRVFACTSLNSRTFSMAITAWSAKVCSNWT